MQLQIKNYTASYQNGPNIIHDINLEIHENEICTLIGPNGAGKSTVLRSIFGLTETKSGKIIHGSREISNLKTDQIVRSGIAFVTQGNNIFPDLTVEENLEMGAFCLQNKQEIEQKKESVLEFFPKLKTFYKKNSGVLSGGERQMVAISMGLMLSPEILCLDEPSIGLAPKIIEEIFDKIITIKKSGTTVIMVEQNAIKALRISDQAAVMENGRIALQGKAKEILENPKVAQLYLGG